MIKFYDCFCFNNELDILIARLTILAPVTDGFLIIEAQQTHSGISKPLYFRNSIPLIRESVGDEIFKKIVPCVVPEFPQTQDPWVRERHQRDSIGSNLKDAFDPSPEDIIFCSDLDEIVCPDVVTRLKTRWLDFAADYIPISMWMSYFYANYVKISGLESEWLGPFFCKVMVLDKHSPSELRSRCKRRHPNTMHSACRYAGWHLSYHGDELFFKHKLRAFAHQESSVQSVSTAIENYIASRQGPFDRDTGSAWAILPPEWINFPIEMLARGEKGSVRIRTPYDSFTEIIKTVEDNHVLRTQNERSIQSLLKLLLRQLWARLF